ncbi:hypothetical protein F5148DRAFT_1268043 [Russula earlei]|uniref:Uncharacterized protein n=1 Tax=Russula earlei TaxID=71964 RepID=A0ACC0TS01_9AGAM|nr:hypothetical protein F5148DRAFT_1268043 [Russula earlei]
MCRKGMNGAPHVVPFKSTVIAVVVALVKQLLTPPLLLAWHQGICIPCFSMTLESVPSCLTFWHTQLLCAKLRTCVFHFINLYCLGDVYVGE